MNEFLQAFNRFMPVLLGLIPAALLHWPTAARRQSRGQTFFGARVETGFSESIAGQAILRQFRWRLWPASLAGVAVSLATPVAIAGFVASMSGVLAGSVAFALANGRTRREARADVTPAVRVASLAVEEDPESCWLGILDWLAMLVPPVVPAVSLVILVLGWHQITGVHPGTPRLFPIFFSLTLGTMCAANQWALRFRARSSDWAPTPGASHKYRTYLGAMQSSVFAFLICQMCWFAVMPSVDMRFYFRFAFPVEAIWLFGVWRMRFWLTKHIAPESADPMADSCWKWGSVYYNPEDPAIVVPLRTGMGQSFNCARPSVWVVGGAVMALTIVSLVQSFEGLLKAGR